MREAAAITAEVERTTVVKETVTVGLKITDACDSNKEFFVVIEPIDRPFGPLKFRGRLPHPDDDYVCVSFEAESSLLALLTNRNAARADIAAKAAA